MKIKASPEIIKAYNYFSFS